MIDKDFVDYVESLSLFDIKKMLRRLNAEKYPEKADFLKKYIKQKQEKETKDEVKRSEYLKRKREAAEKRRKEAITKMEKARAQKKQEKFRKNSSKSELDLDLYGEYLPKNNTLKNNDEEFDEMDIDIDLTTQIQSDLKRTGDLGYEIVDENIDSPNTENIDEPSNVYEKVISKRFKTSKTKINNGTYELDELDGHSIGKIQAIFLLLISILSGVVSFTGALSTSLWAAFMSFIFIIFTISIQVVGAYVVTRVCVWIYNLIASKYIKVKFDLEMTGFNIIGGTMKVEIKKITPLNISIIYAIIMGLFSILFIPFMLIFSALMPGGGNTRFIAGVGALLLPVIYVVLGFGLTYVFVLLYNYIAKKYVAFEMEISEIND